MASRSDAIHTSTSAQRALVVARSQSTRTSVISDSATVQSFVFAMGPNLPSQE